MGVITTAVYVGIAVAIVIILFNVIHLIMSIIFKVKLEIFSLMYPMISKYMFRFERNHTSYRLGWLPLGGYVKYAGMTIAEVGDMQHVKEYMLLGKTPFVRFICMKVSPMLLLIPMVIALFFIHESHSFTVGFEVFVDVIYNLYQYLFSIIDATQANDTWNAITENHAIYPIVFCVISLLTAVSSLISSINIGSEEKETALDKAVSLIQGILALYFIYKAVVLYFSVCSFSEVVLSIFKFTITVYIISFFFILLIRILPKNKHF